MSFDPKNKEHKAKLYPVLKALADLDPRKTPELIIDDAVGYPIARGTDYARNMRRGEINATFAKLTYDWLEMHHFDLAHRISPEIFPETVEQRWQRVLDERAVEGRLKLVLVPRTMGIVERESELRPVATTIRLGQRFCFELDCETEGYAIAIQGVRGQWHAITLGSKGDFGQAVKPGKKSSADKRRRVYRTPGRKLRRGITRLRISMYKFTRTCLFQQTS
ncbi:hypothetical protein QTA57_17915 [Fontisubflavum oceani]|uniref:hypothetical protein n=1 Tax=Fontisubflavum oceani TaxID=2978973 RepID=UPI0025B3EDE1|nr:hypothetical protein [Fontisubflavum oceani]WJY21576.1 hypothetical protein QTA57_17915 [Fontisubflavum oceani]